MPSMMEKVQQAAVAKAMGVIKNAMKKAVAAVTGADPLQELGNLEKLINSGETWVVGQ